MRRVPRSRTHSPSRAERTRGLLPMRDRIMKRSLRAPIRTADLVRQENGLGDLHHGGSGVGPRWPGCQASGHRSSHVTLLGARASVRAVGTVPTGSYRLTTERSPLRDALLALEQWPREIWPSGARLRAEGDDEESRDTISATVAWTCGGATRTWDAPLDYCDLHHLGDEQPRSQSEALSGPRHSNRRRDPE